MNPSTAVPEPILSYISSEKSRGVSDQVIQTQLATQGWPSDTISAAFTQLGVGAPPVASMPIAQPVAQPSVQGAAQPSAGQTMQTGSAMSQPAAATQQNAVPQQLQQFSLSDLQSLPQDIGQDQAPFQLQSQASTAAPAQTLPGPLGSGPGQSSQLPAMPIGQPQPQFAAQPQPQLQPLGQPQFPQQPQQLASLAQPGMMPLDPMATLGMPQQVGASGQFSQPAQFAQPGQYGQPAQFAQPGQFGGPQQFGAPAQFAAQGQFPQPGQYGQPQQPGQQPGTQQFQQPLMQPPIQPMMLPPMQPGSPMGGQPMMVSGDGSYAQSPELTEDPVGFAGSNLSSIILTLRRVTGYDKIMDKLMR